MLRLPVLPWFRFAIMGLLIVAGLHVSACDVGNEPENSPQRMFRINSFRPVPNDWAHQWTYGDLPLSAAAVIDADGDGHWEIFLGGGTGQADVLVIYKNGQLQSHQDSDALSAMSASYGAVASDIDLDGRTDLIVSRADGVTLYLNRTQTGGRLRFEHQLLRQLALPSNHLVLGVAPADYDGDGDIDLYLTTYPRPSAPSDDGARRYPQNILLRNDGPWRFTDATAEANAYSSHPSHTALWADFNQDGLLDLVVASAGATPLLLQNMGGKFQATTLPLGDGFWHGLAIGDIDNDGDADLFFGNMGISIPHWILKTRLRESQTLATDWALLRNEGGMQFRDISSIYGVDGYGYGRGAVMDDLNLDGRLDLIVAQNAIRWPPHWVRKLSGKLLLNLEGYDPPLRQVDALGLNNPYFGQSPLLVDLDADGRQDVVWLNIDGPLRAFLNRSRENFLMLGLPDRADLVGTRATLIYEDTRSFTYFMSNNIGLSTDQSPDISFGLGGRGRVVQVVVDWVDGQRSIVKAPPINQRLVIAPPK